MINKKKKDENSEKAEGDRISKAVFLSLRQISYIPCLSKVAQVSENTMTRLDLQFEENYRYATNIGMNIYHLKPNYEEHENAVKNRHQDHNDFTTKH